MCIRDRQGPVAPGEADQGVVDGGVPVRVELHGLAYYVSALGTGPAQPVSYTHLDVYKRQGLHRGGLLLIPAIGHIDGALVEAVLQVKELHLAVVQHIRFGHDGDLSLIHI